MTHFHHLAAAVVALAFAACGGEAGTEPDDDGYITASVSLNVAGIADVGAVVVEITGPGIAPPIVVNLTIQGGTASGMLTIPTGSDRTITVRVYDGSAIETHRGAVTMDIVEGTSPSLSLTAEPLSGEVPIEVQIGVFSVTVSPETKTLLVGDTTRFAAEVRDGAGNVLTVEVTWATTNPVLADVDTQGLLTALAPGELSVVATYRGFADHASVFIEGGGP